MGVFIVWFQGLFRSSYALVVAGDETEAEGLAREHIGKSERWEGETVEIYDVSMWDQKQNPVLVVDEHGVYALAGFGDTVSEVYPWMAGQEEG